MHIAALHRYPVKSMGGESLTRATLTARGLAGDRRWMMVTPDGRFLTRRELPAMALFAVEDRGADGLVLRHPAAADLALAIPAGAARFPVTVWRDSVLATPAGETADGWLSAVLGRPVRLVYMDEATVRPVDPEYGAADDRVGFADGFPLLVTTTASLDALNAALAEAGADPVTMARFRPNLVIGGAGAAFAEDGWQRLRVGTLTLRLVKPCTRCVITTQDPASGAPLGKEPLATLRKLGRLWERMPVFGVNAIPDGAGDLSVGDQVAVLA